MPKIAAGLSAVLEISLLVRVMLKRNVDRRNGLVNGATGVVKEIERKREEVSRIGIQSVQSFGITFKFCKYVLDSTVWVINWYGLTGFQPHSTAKLEYVCQELNSQLPLHSQHQSTSRKDSPFEML